MSTWDEQYEALVQLVVKEATAAADVLDAPISVPAALREAADRIAEERELETFVMDEITLW